MRDKLFQGGLLFMIRIEFFHTTPCLLGDDVNVAAFLMQCYHRLTVALLNRIRRQRMKFAGGLGGSVFDVKMGPY